MHNHIRSSLIHFLRNIHHYNSSNIAVLMLSFDIFHPGKDCISFIAELFAVVRSPRFR